MMQAVNRIIDSLIKLGVMPGLVVRVGRRDRVLFEKAYGYDAMGSRRRRVKAGQVYDLASLSKVVATTSAIAILVQEGIVSLDDRMSSYLRQLSSRDKKGITIRQALAHSAGFAGHCSFYKGSARGSEQAVQQAAALPLVQAPGKSTLYSDLGFILLGSLAEQASGMTLDEFAKHKVFGPLGMACGFRPLANGVARRKIAPTEKCKWRRKVVRGEVHDENAYAMGGVAGHAGLFGSASDLGAFAMEVINAGRRGRGKVFGKSYREFLAYQPSGTPGSRALGWDTNQAGASSGGNHLSPGSIGMTGFTGTSLWIDLQRQAYVVILTNRVHPTRDNRAFLSARPLLHDLLVKELL